MAEDPQGNTGVITELDIRIWLRDTDPAANQLIDDLEFEPEEIRTAMTLTVDHWNDVPPGIGTFNVNTFPWRSALLRGTAANLLFIAGHRYRRNSLTYKVPGGTVADQEKNKDYDEAGAKLWDEYKAWTQHNKRAQNMEMGWGIIGGGLGRYSQY